MNRQPQVLIVEQDPEDRAWLAKQLGLSGFGIVGQAGYGVEAVTMAADSRPDIIVVGIEEPVARGLHTLDTLALRAPNSVRVVISSLMDPIYLRKAMLAGASEYLDRRLSPQDLSNSLLVALQRDTRRREMTEEPGDAAPRGSIVTVVGPKGGIGKTTLAINLAAAIAGRCQERCVIIDLDTQFGDVAVMLDVQPTLTIIDLVRDIDNVDRTTVQQYLTRHSSGVMVLPAPRRPSEWMPVSPEQVSRVLTLLADVFDCVVIDTPGTFNENVAKALQLANLVLLVCNPDTASIKDSMISLELMRAWEFDSDKVKLVVNYSHPPNGLREKHVSEALQYPIFWSLPYDRRLAQYSHAGEAIVLAAPRAPLAHRVNELAFAVTGGSGRGSRRSDQPNPQPIAARRPAQALPAKSTQTTWQRLIGLLAG